jgi:hypothetical protein
MAFVPEKGGLLPAYVSYNKSVEPEFRVAFGCFSMNAFDRIRFLRLPDSHISELEKTIQRVWSRGIQERGKYDEAYEFKLRGLPWSMKTLSGDTKPEPRRLVCAVLECLYNLGWIYKASVDVSKKGSDKGKSLGT